MKYPKPTTKMSTPLKTGNAKNNRPASEYAPPHFMDGAPLKKEDVGYKLEMPTRKNWTPLNGGVAIGNFDTVKEDGIEMRGAGAAEKGRMSRGPMA